MREVLTILFYKSMESGGGGNGMEDWAIGCVWLELYSHLIETPTLTQLTRNAAGKRQNPGRYTTAVRPALQLVRYGCLGLFLTF